MVFVNSDLIASNLSIVFVLTDNCSASNCLRDFCFFLLATGRSILIIFWLTFFCWLSRSHCSRKSRLAYFSKSWIWVSGHWEISIISVLEHCLSVSDFYHESRYLCVLLEFLQSSRGSRKYRSLFCSWLCLQILIPIPDFHHLNWANCKGRAVLVNICRIPNFYS